MITKSQDFNYAVAVNNISDLKKRFPFAEFSVIGRSWCSRGIFSMSVGSGKECVLFAGGIRGQEWLTPAVLFHFFERLCIAYQNDMKVSAIKIKNALSERKIIVVPLINPDSLQIAALGEDGAGCYRGLAKRACNGDYSGWNANARGVDITKNFNFCFDGGREINRPSPINYGGPSAESEPETRAMVNLCANNNFRHAVLVSSAGEKIFYNSKEKSSDTAMMAQIFKSVCNYTIGRKTQAEKQGGFCEWFTEEYSKPSFEIKAGNGTNPLSFDGFSDTYERLEELLILSAIM